MNFIVAVPLLILGAAGTWWLSKHAPKGILIVVGVSLHVVGRLLSSQFRMVVGIEGERLGSFSQRLIADIALPMQILGTIAVIHGIIVLFKKKKDSQPKVGQVSSEAAPSAPPDEPSM